MLAVLPRGLTFVEWVDAMTPLLEMHGAVPRVESEDDWRWWASEIVKLDAIAPVQPPPPAEFDDWRDWAEAWIGAFG